MKYFNGDKTHSSEKLLTAGDILKVRCLKLSLVYFWPVAIRDYKPTCTIYIHDINSAQDSFPLLNVSPQRNSALWALKY